MSAEEKAAAMSVAADGTQLTVAREDQAATVSAAVMADYMSALLVHV